MNSGLPSLLDAIFGKQNLDSVSKEEIYELVNEFPSFNAGHFLLSKKLKEQNEAVYEKETMRTALYFNNPFWLESALNEESHRFLEKIKPVIRKEAEIDFPVNEVAVSVSEINESEIPQEKFNAEPDPLVFDQSFTPSNEFLPSFEEEKDLEKISEPLPSIPEEPLPEYTDGPVKSFDDLISKYHIEPVTNVEEVEHHSSDNTEIPSVGKPVDFHESGNAEPEADSYGVISNELADDYEIREEVINEYGIFEEVKVRRSDFDMEAFDRPVSNDPDDAANTPDSIAADEREKNESAGEMLLTEVPELLHEAKSENLISEETYDEQNQSDYDAFDPEIDQPAESETEQPAENHIEEESISEIYSGQEARLESFNTHSTADEAEADDNSFRESDSGSFKMPGIAAHYVEEQKGKTPFDPKKAESIVFAPYHMIDYFASQGIKLVLEENPVDPFAKQLKSFTDWLKVMKKLPAQTLSEKTDEKEVDRIRHFAAHSIDEREILTESMAEVLAKQGMFENAIALFQKLSLIYPPKSAYFASRIEQLKASLP